MSPLGDRSSTNPGPIVPGEPAWEVARLFPPQGSWTEDDYLELDTGQLVEFSEGCVEVLEMPTKEDQRMVRYLFQLLGNFVMARGLGEVFFAPLPVRLWAEKFREPDLVFLRRQRAEYRGYPDGADLVIEVVSEGEANRRRDLEIKRREYARAAVEEYWIVDPVSATITVLTGPAYEHERIFGRDDLASSVILTGFAVPVSELLLAANKTWPES